MDKTLFNLQRLSCQEQAGMVWIGGDTLRDKGLWGVKDMGAALQPFLYDYSGENDTGILPPSHASHLIGYREWDLEANWQLLVETVLESYHVKHLHKRTLGQVTHPTWAMVSEYMDDFFNVRHVVPLRTFEPPTASEAQENGDWTDQTTRDFLGQTSTAFIVFPMTSINFFKRFVMFSTIEPALVKGSSSSGTATPSTSSKVRMWALSHRFYDPTSEDEPDGEKQQRRDLDSLTNELEKYRLQEVENQNKIYEKQRFYREPGG